ncbi:MAG: hypothetical protein JWP11_2488 [Frankiales bacterium]|nr:hypothetical protein [Frankiales bacterium]
MSHHVCGDCGELAVWEISSTVDGGATTAMVACAVHRLDATEHMLNQYGNVTITESLG